MAVSRYGATIHPVPLRDSTREHALDMARKENTTVYVLPSIDNVALLTTDATCPMWHGLTRYIVEPDGTITGQKHRYDVARGSYWAPIEPDDLVVGSDFDWGERILPGDHAIGTLRDVPKDERL